MRWRPPVERIKRPKRIEGQVRGVQGMVEDERYCARIMVRIPALRRRCGRWPGIFPASSRDASGLVPTYFDAAHLRARLRLFARNASWRGEEGSWAQPSS